MKEISLKDRVKNVENFIIFLVLALSSYYNVVSGKSLSASLLSFHLIVFFISTYISTYYFAKILLNVIETSSTELGKLINSVYEKTKRWIAYLVYLLLLLIVVGIIRYVTDFDWKEIIGSSLRGIFVLLLSKGKEIIEKIKKIFNKE